LFYLAGRYPPNKSLVSVQKADFIPYQCTLQRLSFISRRDGVYDPIAVSSPSRKLSEPEADWIIREFLRDLRVSVVNLDSDGAISNPKVQ